MNFGEFIGRYCENIIDFTKKLETMRRNNKTPEYFSPGLKMCFKNIALLSIVSPS